MRRSISYTEPKIALAGESKTWKFIFTPAADLPKGARLKFDLKSKGRSFDWEIPQVDLNAKANLIWLSLQNQKPIAGKALAAPKGHLPQFEFILPKLIKAGEPITIMMGSLSAKGRGNRAQCYTWRRRPFSLHIDPKGKGEYKDLETFYLDVRGNALHSIRIIVPSIVSKNLRFDVVVRFEDRYGNLTGNAPEGMLIEFSYDRLRENINWKLFVPETGFINLPNLYFNEVGIYRIRLKNLSTGEVFHSTPIKCFAESIHSIFWGSFHSESILHNASSDVETFLRHNRDEQALQFLGTSSFESESETPQDLWKVISSHVSEFNEDDRFTTFLGMQWAGAPKTEGLRQIVYLKDNKSILRRKEGKASHLKKIYKSHTTKDFLAIPSLTMGDKTCYDFENFAPEYEKAVEIYNAWGSSECTEAEGNSRPIRSKGKAGIKESKEGSIRSALNQNCRFGFVAGGYDDRGIFSPLFNSDQVQYSAGLTAIFSAGHSRDAIIQAINRRACYATTGPRMILGLFIAGAPIGSELNGTAKPGLLYNRHLTGHVVGTAPIKEVLIIRNGKPFYTHKPKSETYEFAIDDSELFDTICLKPSSTEAPPFIYYYLRITQEDDHLGWSSPIWIDQSGAVVEKKKKG